MYGEEGREDAGVDGGEGCAEEDLERLVEEVLGVRKAAVRFMTDFMVYDLGFELVSALFSEEEVWKCQLYSSHCREWELRICFDLIRSLDRSPVRYLIWLTTNYYSVISVV